MPQDRHPHVGRARSLSEADSANSGGCSPQSESESGARAESDSDSESEARRPQGAGRVLLLCPGCNKSFDNISSLRRHRNSYWMTDPTCRVAGSRSKRPRRVRVHDSESAQDAIDRINEMMGDGTDRGVPPGAALNPCLQPRDEVGDSDVTSRPKVTVYTEFATCLHIVYTTFESGLQSLYTRFVKCLHQVCTYILSVYSEFIGGRPGWRPSRGGSGTALA